MSKTLDLGSGAKPKNPFHADEVFGIDVMEDLSANIKSADLVVEPIPYEDESFEYLTAYDFLEHVPRLIYAPERRNAFVEVMNEVYRVLKPGGIFLASTPAYPHAVAFRDPTHVNFITEETFPCYFDDVTRWASIYGFKGAFTVKMNEWRGPHLLVAMRKTVPPGQAPQAPRAGQKISVLIPTYNGEKYLRQTLESALKQTAPDFEVLCIDDCSTDGTLGILNELSASDPRVRVLKTDRNLGSVPKVLNFALPQMTGDYFVYASQDDLFSVDWLEKMHRRAVETGADAVLPDVVFYHEDPAVKGRSMIGLDGDRSVELSNRQAVELSLDWTIPANALWNASLVKRIGFEEFASNADEYSGRVLFMNCNKVVFSEGTFFYRQDNDQAVTKKTGCRTFDLPYTHLRLAQFLQENDFPSQLIDTEKKKAAKTLVGLEKWLAENSPVLSAPEVTDIEARIARYHQRLAMAHPFDVRHRAPARRRLSAWWRSVRRLWRR